MNDVARLGLEVESSSVRAATVDLDKLPGAAERAEHGADRLKGGFDRAERGAGAFAGALGVVLPLLTAVAGALSVGALGRYADAWSDMQSRVGAAIRDMEAAPAMMQRIVDIANASYSPLEQTAEIFSRNVSVLRELGIGASGAADFTEALNHALVITATRGQRATAVQDALSKAMAVGRLQADGLETVLANGGRVAEVLAEELGTTVNGLRAMASEGKITSDVIAGSLIRRLDELREQAGEMPATIGDAFTRINTNVTALIGTLDQAWGISGRVAEQMLGFADGILAASDTLLRMGNIAAAVLGPSLDIVSSGLQAVSQYGAIAVAALAGFFAPAVLAGIGTLITLIGSGLVGAIRAVTVAMMANPLGLLIAGISGAVAAAVIFRDQIRQTIGIDLIGVMVDAGNKTIGVFVGAFEAIKSVWSLLPSAMGDIVIRVANVIVVGVEEAINKAAELLDAFINKANEGLGQFGLAIPNVGRVNFGGFNNPFAGAADDLGSTASAAFSDAQQNYIQGMSDALGEAWTNSEGATQSLQEMASALGGGAQSGAGGAGGGVNGALQAANDNIASLRDAMSDFIDIEDPFTTVQDNLAALQELLAAGEISWAQYGHAAALAMADAASATLSAVGKQTSMLASAFEDNKAFALANAVVSGLEAVVSSYAAGARIGGPIVGAAFAATAAAATAAQIGAIMSAKPGSASMGGAGGGGTAAAPAPVAPPEPSRTINVTLGGNGRYSRDEVRDLLEQLTGELNDGAGTKFKMAVNS